MRLHLRARAWQHLAGLSMPLLIGVLVIAALGVRLHHGDEPPMDFHATRQYRSLLITRSLYLEASASAPAWSKAVAAASSERQGMLEPPIMEHLVASLYRLSGSESMLAPRLLTSFFWLVGGGLLYLIALHITSELEALFTLAFYLFLPFAVSASRSFQPDSLMLLLLLASVYWSLRYQLQPTKAGLTLAVGAAAGAAFVKPTAIFVALTVFFALAVARQGLWPILRAPALWSFALIAALPMATFYLYGIVSTDTLRNQAEASFIPQLVLKPFFWRGWITNIGQVIGFGVLVVALLGSLLVPRGIPLALMVGLWSGYGLFCLVFSYHIATHDYYHLQLVPIVALSLGPVFALLADAIARPQAPALARPIMWGILALALLLCVGLLMARPRNPALVERVAVAEEVGAQVNHSTRTVYLAFDYGLPLEYHGQLAGVPWPNAADLEWGDLAGAPTLSAKERYAAWFAPLGPEYFIVTDLQEYAAQPDLQAFLTENYPLVAQEETYLIFDLSRPAQAGP